jgi:hypothetical protein
MDFTKLHETKLDNLILGNKYYIQKINQNEKHPGNGQQYGIFDGFEVYENEITYALFRKTYDFKNPITNEVLKSGMGTGDGEKSLHKKWFLFYEPRIVTYNRKQNELLGKAIEQITNDEYMGKYISNQGWLGIIFNHNAFV